jgi:riboflavin kinase/FMN adenylyltransferase
VAPEAAPKLITPLATKADLIAGLGVEELIVVPFDGVFSSQSAQEFIDHVLVERVGAERVSVGENFRFGHRAKGDAALLQAQDAFQTHVVELVEVEGEIVSSTHIRGLIAAGDVDGASHFLGSPYQFRGIVMHGDKRGRTLGFPTANLVPPNELCYPGHGIYACRAAVEIDGEWRWWPAAVNVGVRPTFVTGRGVLIEAFLIDFDDDLYGRELRLAFLSRLRGERRFESTEALVDQMARDVEQAQRIAT